MSTVGRNIEIAMQSIMTVSEEFAKLQAEHDGLLNETNMMDTLFSVTRYIWSNPEEENVLSVLEDSIKGVFGTSYAHVVMDKKNQYIPNTAESVHYFDFDKMEKAVETILVIENVSMSNITDLDEGSLVIIRLGVGDELSGFLTCYWENENVLSESSLIFLQIISSQVSMYLKNIKLLNKFQKQAIIDPLTGIYNRAYFVDIQENAVPIVGESIILFDLDKFKVINDTKGHQYGDKILIRFANILQKTAEENGATAFRYGGEEFIVKSYDGQSKALSIAKRVSEEFFETTGYSVSVGISTGGETCRVACYESFIQQADDALYVSKECGRNRITTSSADIQLLKASSSSISNLISHSFRESTEISLFRIKILNDSIMTLEEFQDLKRTISTLTRLYDEAFFTTSLECMIIFYGQVEEEVFTRRVNKVLLQKLPHLKYELYCLNRTFHEVIIHSTRVSELSQIIAAELGYSKDIVNQIRLASEWHDVGKFCTDPAVYSKEGRLTDDEYEIIKMHSWLSFNIADNHPILSEFADWILYHHEDYNGSGYLGLVGEQIPLPAQIIGLVDKFDALTEDRVYRKAYDWKIAVEILKKESESERFNLEFFNLFESIITRLMNNNSIS